MHGTTTQNTEAWLILLQQFVEEEKWSSYENGASVLLPRNIQGYYANGMIMTIIMEWHYNGITNF